MRSAPGSSHEISRDLPIRTEADVVVAGGGLGGVAAALASARAGAKTVLVERNGFLGGTATAGMCCSVFNCYSTSKGELATRGIPLEIADALAEATGYGAAWRRHKGHVIYDLERGKLVLEELLDRAGVEVLLNTLTAGALVREGTGDTGRCLEATAVESKSGREAIRGGVFVDATGDADLAALAGAHVEVRDTGAHSLCFRLGNVDVDRFVGYFRDHPDQYPEQMDVEWTLAEALAQYGECGTFLFPHGGGMQMQVFQSAREAGRLPERIGVHDSTDACQMHAIRRTGVVHVITGFARFDGLEAARISRAMIDGRRMAFAVAEVYRQSIPGFERSFVVDTATNLGVRTSRFIRGELVFTAAMMQAGVRHPDAVGRAVGWDHEVRHHGKGAWGVQALRSDSFDLPYRCLLPLGVEGLLMGAGRSVSSENPALLRCMVHTMVVGQAAGAAVAVATREGQSPRAVDIDAVQAELRRQGVPV